MSIYVNASNNFKRQLVPSVFVAFRNQLYAVNYPESTNRFSRELGKKVGTSINVFVTGSEPEYYMGILGLLQKMNKKTSKMEAFIYCHEDTISPIMHLKNIMRVRHLFFGYFGLGKEGRDRKIYGIDKGNLTKYQKLFETNPKLYSQWEILSNELPESVISDLIDPTRTFCQESIAIPQSILQTANIRVMDQNDVEIVMAPVENNDKSRTHISLLFTLKGNRTRLDRNLVKEMNLTSGDCQNLMAQNFIDLPSGKRVSLEEIKISTKNTGIAFLEIPDESFMNALQDNPFINWLSNGSNESCDIKYIFHLAPAHIVLSPRYIAWLEAEPVNQLNHVFIHVTMDQEFNQKQKDEFGLRYRLYYSFLNRLFPFFFPRIDWEPYNHLDALANLKCLKTVFTSFKQFLVHLESFRTTDLQEQVKILNPTFTTNAIQNDPCYAISRHVIGRQNTFDAFPFFITLGTGSSFATTYRNMTSILFAVNENLYGMMDCGEGTYYQLSEQFGDRVEDVLCKLQIIMITHLHGDHFLGILLLIQKRAQALKKIDEKLTRPKMFLCLPSNCVTNILNYIEENEKHLDFHLSIIINQEIAKIELPRDSYLSRFVGIDDHETKTFNFIKKVEPNTFVIKSGLNKKFPNRINDYKTFIAESEIDRILPVPVVHCPEAVGFVVDIKGKRFVYSGDCRMTQELAHYGKDADILIHEATFDCAMDLIEVLSKNHSNIRHALMIAKLMNAKHTCLTHFSQRYRLSSSLDKVIDISIPGEKDLLEYFEQKTFLAQDHMYFDLETVAVLQSINKLVNFYYRFIPQETDSINQSSN
jgi:ribonuclease BN (tRNA processing enzyme)